MDTPSTLVLNGRSAGKRSQREFVHALGDSRILQSCGGYLFKSLYDQGILHVGIVPAISEGERSHHYDIRIPQGLNLLGTVSATGEFSILFKAERDHLDSESRSFWKSQYCGFASGILHWGYQGQGALDWITQQILQEAELFDPIPKILSEFLLVTGC